LLALERFHTASVDCGPSFIVRKPAAVGGLPTFDNPVANG